MFKHYLSTALRHFARHKTTTAINVLSLAFGFICFALAFGMVRYTTMADRYHEKADRTYVLTQRIDFYGGMTSIQMGPQSGFGLAKHLKLDFPDIEIAARAFAPSEIPIQAGTEQRFVEIVYADPQLLDVFEFNFLSGDRRNALKQPRSAVITEELAKQLYGRTDVIGEPILVANRETVHITGVVGRQRQPTHISTDPSPGILRFSLLVSADTKEGISNNSVEPSNVFNWIFSMNAMTYLVFPESGALTPAQLNAQLPTFFKRKWSDNCCVAQFGLRPVSEIGAARFDFLIKRDTTGLSQTAVLSILGALVLVVSCLNYANLASAQAVTRLKEIALHRVVGAYRSQIALQSLIEALLVSSLSVFVALLILPFAIGMLKAQVGIDLTVSIFESVLFWISILTAMFGATLFASSYPALIASRVRPARAMQGGRVPQSKRPVMQALVIGQFAMASFLFIATGVMYVQNKRVLRESSPEVDPVIRIDNLLSTAKVDAKTLKAELLQHPAVKSVGGSNVRPGTLSGPIFMARGDAGEHSRSWIVSVPNIDTDFFSTMGIPLLAGRNFDPSNADDAKFGPSNVIIDRALAEEYGWHNPNDAIGKAIYTAGEVGGEPEPVIGVVENANLLPIVTVGTASTMYKFNSGNSETHFVRVSKNDVTGALEAIDSTWRKLSPNVPLKRSFVNEQYESLYRQVSSITFVIRLAAFLALFIGALGLIGIATHAIAQRTFEVGVRRTFGATVTQVLGMLLKDFSKPIVLANLVAWPLAFVAAKAYGSLFADRAAISPAPFVLSLLLGLSIAWLAVIRQAARAASLNPASVLRQE